MSNTEEARKQNEVLHKMAFDTFCQRMKEIYDNDSLTVVVSVTSDEARSLSAMVKSDEDMVLNLVYLLSDKHIQRHLKIAQRFIEDHRDDLKSHGRL